MKEIVQNLTNRIPLISIPANAKDILIRIFLYSFSLVTILCLFVPFTPYIPGYELDDSWRITTSEAMSRGLSFGSDIIFTYGPYSFIQTMVYNPDKEAQIFAYCIYLSTMFLINIWIFIKDHKYDWQHFFTYSLFIILIAINSDASKPDVRILLYILLAWINIFRIAYIEEIKPSPEWKRLILLSLILSPFGLLPLIKQSSLLPCAVAAMVATTTFIFHGLKKMAAACIAVPIASLLLFWSMIGQKLTQLPTYFIGLISITSGYNEAMAVNGPIHEPILYVVISFFLLMSVIYNRRISVSDKLLLLIPCSFLLFVFFKLGFVRHDNGHAAQSPAWLLLTSTIFYLYARKEKWETFNHLIVLAASTFLFFGTALTNINKDGNIISAITKKLDFPYTKSWAGIKNSFHDPNWVNTKFRNNMNEIRNKWNFPIISGTTDIYPIHQMIPLAYGYDWNPRPIFQSYSAYTPFLADKNREHLIGRHAPDNIIFMTGGNIDGRLPSLDDGASWPLLMQNYTPINIVVNDQAILLYNGFLFLQKKIDEPVDVPIEGGISDIHYMNERVVLPETSGHPLFAYVSVEPTIIGKLLGALYKPSQLRINIETDDGVTYVYRFISNMGKSGFIISPLIKNTRDFIVLLGRGNACDAKMVKSVRITDTSSLDGLFWKNKYTSRFVQLPNSIECQKEPPAEQNPQ